MVVVFARPCDRKYGSSNLRERLGRWARSEVALAPDLQAAAFRASDIRLGQRGGDARRSRPELAYDTSVSTSVPLGKPNVSAPFFADTSRTA